MYTNTDLYKSLLAQRATLLERIEGTSGDTAPAAIYVSATGQTLVRTAEMQTASKRSWHEHWKQELQAVQRALWSLGDEA